MIDFDGVFQYSNGTNDLYALDPLRNPGSTATEVGKLLHDPRFGRAAWRCLSDLANPTNGVMLAANINPTFDANHAALAANGFSLPDPNSSDSDKNWISRQRDNLWTRLATVRPAFAISSPTNGTSTSSSNVTFNGLAAVEIKDITLNSNTVSVTWSTVTNWSFNTPLNLGSNTLQVSGYDRKGNFLVSSNMTVVRTNF